MKLSALCLLSLACHSVAMAAATAPPRRTFAERFFTARAEFTARDDIIRAATLVPGLYGIQFLCRFTSFDPSLKPQTIFPGEWINAPLGGKLHCPDKYELEFAKNSKLRVQQAGAFPLFSLESGEAEITFTSELFYFDTPALSAAVRGAGKEQKLTFSALPKLQAMDCGRGALSVLYADKEGFKDERLIVSRQCRLEVFVEGTALTRFFLAGDRALTENFTVRRAYWPNVPAGTLTTLMQDQADRHNITLHAIAGAPGKIAWQMADEFSNSSCTLFGQRDELSPMVELSKFKGSRSGETSINAAFLPGIASVICETDKLTESSNAAPTVVK